MTPDSYDKVLRKLSSEPTRVTHLLINDYIYAANAAVS